MKINVRKKLFEKLDEVDKKGFDVGRCMWNDKISVTLMKKIGDVEFQYYRKIPFPLKLDNETYIILNSKEEKKWRKIRDRFITMVVNELQKWIDAKAKRVERLLVD